MLRLIIGTAGTGKSRYILQKILHNAAQGKKSMLIVPEQFSKTAEAEIFSALEKNSYGNVNVFSFTSLLRDVQSEKGQVPPVLLTDAGKAVAAQKSLQAVHHQLESYGRLRHNVGFAYQLSRLFEDFRRNGVIGGQLFSLAQSAPAANVKLRDVALIYSQYCADIMAGGQDLEQLYLELSTTLPESYTDSTQVFIDGFESFTHGQYAIIDRLMQKAEDVYVALTADRVFDNTNGTHPLSYTAQTAQKLIANAKKLGVETPVALKLTQKHRFLNDTLRNVDSFLLSQPLTDTVNDKAFVTVFDTQFAEAGFVAAQINKLTQQGYTYNDIAVVSPQIDRYEHQLQESFSLAGIPYFIDQSRIILSSAPVVLFRSVLEVMDRGVNQATVLPLLKTRLTDADSLAVDLLENYTYIWQGQNLDWNRPFTLPFGRIDDGEVTDADDESLAAINRLVKRVKTVFAQHTGGEDLGENILAAMYDIITDLGCEQVMTDIIQSTPDKEKADLLVRQWETAIDCINGLYTMCGKSVVTAGQLQELFMLMVQGTEIGFAPQTQDCVLVSTPQRMKTDTVKAVFVVGASQDVFPLLVSDSSILSSADIQYLKDNDCQLSSDFAQRFAFENLYFYKAVTTARELLYISCAAKNIDRQELLSAEVDSIRDALKLGSARLEIEDYCITEEFFVQYVSEIYGADGIKMLENLGMDVPQITRRSFNIQDLDSLRQLVGNHMVISPTAAESYCKCAFSYLIRNLFKIYPLEKAQLSQREAGDYLHTVAQKVMEQYGAQYHRADWNEIETATKAVVQQYLDSNYPQQVRNTARFASLSRDMQQNALQLLKYIYTEQQASLFRPVAFEKQIGFDSDLKPVTVTLDDGSRVSIVGVCDRIDTMEAEGKNFIRIVDYKTGTKKFSLEDVYNGLSSQLLLYMNSVLASGDFLPNAVPAAVIYQPSDAAFKFDDDGSLYMPVGMAVESAQVSQGFDRDCQGSFGVIKGEEKLKSVTGSEIVSPQMFDAVLEHTKYRIKEMAQAVYSGQFDNLPMDLGGEKTACEWCGYRAICGHTNRTKPRQKADFRVKEVDGDG